MVTKHEHEHDSTPRAILVSEPSSRVSMPRWLSVLIPLIGIFVGIGISYGTQASDLRKVQLDINLLHAQVRELSDMKADISSIKTDLNWIKLGLNIKAPTNKKGSIN